MRSIIFVSLCEMRRFAGPFEFAARAIMTYAAPRISALQRAAENTLADFRAEPSVFYNAITRKR